MPDLLFLNIRRYKYNPKRGETQSEHELLRSSEPGLLDGGPRQSFDYVLYSVVVHKERTLNQSHYFSFVNISKHISQKRWIGFNDSIVSETTVEKVLNNYRQEEGFRLLKRGIWQVGLQRGGLRGNHLLVDLLPQRVLRKVPEHGN